MVDTSPGGAGHVQGPTDHHRRRRGGRTKSAVARDYDVSRNWVQTLVKRFEVEGEAAFEPRSRRPRTSPGAVSADVEDRIVRLRISMVSARGGIRGASSAVATRSTMPSSRMSETETFTDAVGWGRGLSTVRNSRGYLEHPLGDVRCQPTALSRAEEVRRVERAALGLVPAHQCLAATRRPRGTDGLVGDGQPTLLQSGLQRCGDGEPPPPVGGAPLRVPGGRHVPDDFEASIAASAAKSRSPRVVQCSGPWPGRCWPGRAVERAAARPARAGWRAAPPRRSSPPPRS